MKRVYKVGLAFVESNGEHSPNWASYNLVAKDVADVMKKVKLKKGEYIESVTIIAHLDE